MTYNGTNSWLIDWQDGTMLLDPGSEDEAHLDAIITEARGRLTHILVSHTHHDHLDGALTLSRHLGIPTAGYQHSADDSFTPDIRLGDGDRIGGLTALYTPGHAMDHLCFTDDRGLIFSGDHVMGWSTSVVPPPPYGDLSLFVAQLQRIRDRRDRLMLSAHGPAITRPFETVQGLIEHRRAREDSIHAVLDSQPRSLENMLGRAYINLKPQLLGPARANLLAHLIKLERDGRAVRTKGGWMQAQGLVSPPLTRWGHQAPDPES